MSPCSHQDFTAVFSLWPPNWLPTLISTEARCLASLLEPEERASWWSFPAGGPRGLFCVVWSPSRAYFLPSCFIALVPQPEGSCPCYHQKPFPDHTSVQHSVPPGPVSRLPKAFASLIIARVWDVCVYKETAEAKNSLSEAYQPPSNEI